MIEHIRRWRLKRQEKKELQRERELFSTSGRYSNFKEGWKIAILYSAPILAGDYGYESKCPGFYTLYLNRRNSEHLYLFRDVPRDNPRLEIHTSKGGEDADRSLVNLIGLETALDKNPWNKRLNSANIGLQDYNSAFNLLTNRNYTYWPKKWDDTIKTDRHYNIEEVSELFEPLLRCFVRERKTSETGWFATDIRGGIVEELIIRHQKESEGLDVDAIFGCAVTRADVLNTGMALSMFPRLVYGFSEGRADAKHVEAMKEVVDILKRFYSLQNGNSSPYQEWELEIYDEMKRTVKILIPSTTLKPVKEEM